MQASLPIMDQVIFRAVEKNEQSIEKILNCHCIFYLGTIGMDMFRNFRNSVERLKKECQEDGCDSSTVSVVLKTPGGEVEVVEKMVDVLRHHYNQVNFIIPDAAFSAGTVFCMSGNKIYMDYSSSLGPIDPQVPDKDGDYLVPALGYLDKVEEIIKKSEEGTVTTAELLMLERQDLGRLRLYEQAKNLSIALLEKWLAEYKFEDWTHHRTNEVGTEVTTAQKKARAKEVGMKLADNKLWHSHGRAINMETLRTELRLEIEDLGKNVELQKAVRFYNDILSDWLIRVGLQSFIFNRRLH